MRKLVTIVAFLGITNAVSAQTQKETSIWLENNRSNIDHVNCPTIQLYGDHLAIDQNSIKLYNDKQTCKIDWNNIQNVKQDDTFFYIVSKEKVDGKNLEMKIFINDQNMKKRFMKAVNHMASFNNTGLVKNDLF